MVSSMTRRLTFIYALFITPFCMLVLYTFDNVSFLQSSTSDKNKAGKDMSRERHKHHDNRPWMDTYPPSEKEQLGGEDSAINPTRLLEPDTQSANKQDEMEHNSHSEQAQSSIATQDQENKSSDTPGDTDALHEKEVTERKDIQLTKDPEGSPSDIHQGSPAANRTDKSEVAADPPATDSSEPQTSGIHQHRAGAANSCDPKCLEELQIPKSDVFYQAGNKTFLYSAYYDDRHENETYVRLIGLSDVNVTLYCHFWWDGVKEADIAITDMAIHWHYEPIEMQNVIIKCKIHRQFSAAPRWVALSDSKCGPPLAIMPITDNRGSPMEANFTVCMHKAFILGYSNVTQFVEWIEVNRILGADKFVVYNYTGGDVLLPYIEHYIKAGILDYHQWPVHQLEHRIPIYMGQGAVIDDCIYRSMYKSKYLMLIDVDEVVVPQKPYDNWTAMIQAPANPCSNAPDMVIKNAFFLHQRPKDEAYVRNASLQPLKLDTLALTSRYNFTFPCPVRSKVIMKPEEGVTAGVHYVVHLTNDRWGEHCCVPKNVALLHHYRFWKTTIKEHWDKELAKDHKGKSFKPYWENFVLDRRLTQFADQIVSRVTHVYSTVKSPPP